MSRPIPPIEEIKWLDSLMINNGEWMSYTDIDEELTSKGMLHRSVGYVVKESDEAVFLALSINYDQVDEENDQRMSGGTVVPKVSIINRSLLIGKRIIGSDETSQDSGE